MSHSSVSELWEAFIADHPEYQSQPQPPADHFGDSEEVAASCVELVLSGKKRVTSHSLLGLQFRKERLPKIGDLNIITDWEGKAYGITRTLKVRLKPFFSISAEHARLEGEGDGSLEYWKTSHWDYYTRELEAFGKTPVESMIIVCEEFELIYKLP